MDESTIKECKEVVENISTYIASAAKLATSKAIVDKLTAAQKNINDARVILSKKNPSRKELLRVADIIKRAGHDVMNYGTLINNVESSSSVN